MKAFLVGGAVRDMLLGREIHDRDFVVVGYSHEEMIERGYRQVGADFPVYLHPETGEEYALARTERRTGIGHKGFETVFTPEVTLEQDLARRDLTINSMAYDMETDEIIDPFGGRRDLQDKVLRATTEAFQEDPLRILRLFRFLAQLGEGWTVDYDTREMILDNMGRLSEIPAERHWKEFEKALHSSRPEVFMMEMASYGQLPELAAMQDFPAGPPEHHPEGDAFTHTMLVVKQAVRLGATPQQIFACMCHDMGKTICWNERGNLHGHEAAGVPVVSALCDRFKVPNGYRKMALTVTEFHGKIHEIRKSKPKTVFDLIVSMNGHKDPEFFRQCAQCSLFDKWGRGPTKVDIPYPEYEYLLTCRQALQDNAQHIGERSREVAEKWKGNPAMVATLIRDMKIAIIRTKIQEMTHEY